MVSEKVRELSHLMHQIAVISQEITEEIERQRVEIARMDAASKEVARLDAEIAAREKDLATITANLDNAKQAYAEFKRKVGLGA